LEGLALADFNCEGGALLVANRTVVALGCIKADLMRLGIGPGYRP
jgi:hypothetical protein